MNKDKQHQKDIQSCIDRLIKNGESPEFAKKHCAKMDRISMPQSTSMNQSSKRTKLDGETTFMGLTAELEQNNEEKLLREFIRKTFVSNLVKEQRGEHAVRSFVRSLISEVRDEQYCSTLFEAKDMANPHPNTGINKLRDAIRKAKPSIKTKYQQLTTDPAQRESFKNHFLTAMVRLFDELDALNAQGAKPEEVEAALDDEKITSDLEAPPEDMTSDEMAADIGDDGDLDALLEAVDVDIEDGDVVSDEFDAEDDKEKEKNKTQAEKDFEKKSADDEKRKEFGAGVEGDSTGRNQAFDAFNLVQTYFSDAYLDLNNPEDIEMYKKWGLYNIKLLLDKYESELNTNPDEPDIEDPT